MLQVRIRVAQLLGEVGLLNDGLDGGPRRSSSLYVTAELSSSGLSLGVRLKTPFAECHGNGALWDSFLRFPIKVARTRHSLATLIRVAFALF